MPTLELEVAATGISALDDITARITQDAINKLPPADRSTFYGALSAGAPELRGWYDSAKTDRMAMYVRACDVSVAGSEVLCVHVRWNKTGADALATGKKIWLDTDGSGQPAPDAPSGRDECTANYAGGTLLDLGPGTVPATDGRGNPVTPYGTFTRAADGDGVVYDGSTNGIVVTNVALPDMRTGNTGLTAVATGIVNVNTASGLESAAKTCRAWDSNWYQVSWSKDTGAPVGTQYSNWQSQRGRSAEGFTNITAGDLETVAWALNDPKNGTFPSRLLQRLNGVFQNTGTNSATASNFYDNTAYTGVGFGCKWDGSAITQLHDGTGRGGVISPAYWTDARLNCIARQFEDAAGFWTPTLVPSGATELNPVSVATAPATVGTPAVSQAAVSLSVAGTATAPPTVGSPAVSQGAVSLVVTSVTTLSQTLGTPTVSQAAVALAPVDVTTAPATTGTPTVTTATVLDVVAVATASQAVGTPAVSQGAVDLQPVAVATHPATVGTPTVNQPTPLNVADLATAQQLVGAPGVDQAPVALSPVAVVTLPATVGTPTVTTTTTLDVVATATALQTVGAPGVSQVSPLAVTGVATALATVGQPILLNTWQLQALGVATHPATVGSPEITQPIEPVPVGLELKEVIRIVQTAWAANWPHGGTYRVDWASNLNLQQPDPGTATHWLHITVRFGRERIRGFGGGDRRNDRLKGGWVEIRCYSAAGYTEDVTLQLLSDALKVFRSQRSGTLSFTGGTRPVGAAGSAGEVDGKWWVRGAAVPFEYRFLG